MNIIAKRMLVVCFTCLTLLILMACNNNEDERNTEASSTSAETEKATNDSFATKRVNHDLGETEIPTEPKRIVSINMEDMLLNLDVNLVLATRRGIYIGKLKNL